MLPRVSTVLWCVTVGVCVYLIANETKMSEESPLLRENEGGHFLRTYPASGSSVTGESASVHVSVSVRQPATTDHAQAGKMRARSFLKFDDFMLSPSRSTCQIIPHCHTRWPTRLAITLVEKRKRGLVAMHTASRSSAWKPSTTIQIQDFELYCCMHVYSQPCNFCSLWRFLWL